MGGPNVYTMSSFEVTDARIFISCTAIQYAMSNLCLILTLSFLDKLVKAMMIGVFEVELCLVAAIASLCMQQSHCMAILLTTSVVTYITGVDQICPHSHFVYTGFVIKA